ncbi:MAG: MBL fold metallo-hydrolase [Segetibacter sp.]
MQSYICTACGIQYEPSEAPPANCAICEDDRQYVNPSGQSWTTLERINEQHKNIIELVASNVYAIYSTPSFAIGQRAHLVISSGGNILWDCITNLDDSTINLINALGGIKAIAISHPHYFSTIAAWSKAFGHIPVYIHQFDEKWLECIPVNLQLWSEKELSLWDDIKLIKCGGHFPGASVMYTPLNNGSLFVGDTIQVAPDLKTVSFMYSYPNMIPLPKAEILQIQDAVNAIKYENIYGAFGRYIKSNAMDAMKFSVKRYLEIFE